jgi:hypothetical protein
MSFSYRGWGLLSPFALLVVVLVSLFAGFAIAGSTVFSWLVMAAILLVAGGLHHLLAMSVNSDATPQGRVWHNRNTLNGLPIQYSGTVPFIAFALIGVAVAIGQWTTGLVGLGFFLVAFVALMILGRRFYRQQVSRNRVSS